MTAAFFVALAVKSTLVAIISLAGNRLLRRRPANEQVAALRAGTLILFALPCAALVLPPLDIAIAAGAAPVSLPEQGIGSGATAYASASADPLSLAAIAVVIYGAGVLILAVRMLGGLFVVSGWTRRSVPVVEPRWLAALDRGCGQVRRPVRLLVSAEIPSPLSWGLWPAIILIDRRTLGCPDRADAVIAHELAHVRGLDWPALLVSRATTAILWFNPFVWLVERALTRRVEMAADEGAAARVERVAYAQMLIDTANGIRAAVPACGMASAPSQLAERVRHILSAGPTRPRGRIVPLAILGGAALAVAPLAAARIVPVAPTAMPASSPIRDQSPAAAANQVALIRTAGPTSRSAQSMRPVRSAQAVRPQRPGGARRRASIPVDQRQMALEMSEQARALRNRAAGTGAVTPRRGPGRDPPEPARALRAEADRLDMGARRLIFGP
jgi:beta-lactamase regulating signal transducer with metallopeptidase domain